MDNEKWWKQVEASSNVFLNYLLQEDWDDTCGWAGILKQMLSERSRPGGVLLAGPSGCGRHSTAWQLCVFLEEQKQFTSLYLSGPDIWMEASGFDQLRGRMDHILNLFYDEKKPLCLVMDQLEDCPWRSELLNYLARTLCEYQLGTQADNPAERYPELFLILIGEDEDSIPSMLRSLLRLCRLTLPDMQHRKAYLTRAETEYLGFVAVDKFAELTEGMTYAQLKDIACNLGRLQDANEKHRVIHDISEIYAFIMGQHSEPKGDSQVAAGILQLAEELQLAGEKLADAITEAAKTMPIGTQVIQTASVPGTVAQTNEGKLNEALQVDQDAKRKEFEEKPVKELLVDALGNDNAERILNQ